MDFWAKWFDLTHGVFSYANAGLIRYREPRRQEVVRLIRRLQRSCEFRMSPVEAYQLHSLVRATQKIPGELAEVGVFKGGSARIICEARAKDKELHLFDTFEGLPAVGELDPKFRAGQFARGIDAVKHALSAYSNVEFHQGLFPVDTGASVADKKFSFVHLDVDIYESTANAIAFFYPRLSPGGIILSHDYIYAEGATRAFEEFFADRPEPLIELGGCQCMIQKIGPSSP